VIILLKTIPEVINTMKHNIKTMSAAEAQKACQREGGIFIDVREPGEFNEKSAAGAINIPRGVLEMKTLQLYPDENIHIFIHCATGVRATFSAEQLQRIGYKNVVVITCKLDDIFASCE
jgi:rhodanese-related sulfurtransferase